MWRVQGIESIDAYLSWDKFIFTANDSLSPSIDDVLCYQLINILKPADREAVHWKQEKTTTLLDLG